MASSHDDIRDSIVNAAREVFARFGYRKTTMDDIAAPLRKAKSSIYHYFAGKEEVFLAVVEREMEIAQEKVEREIGNLSSPPEMLRAFFHAEISALAESRNYFSLLQDEWYEVFSFRERLKERYMQATISKVSSILAAGIASGDFQIDDIEAAAEVIILSAGPFHEPWIPVPQEEIHRKLDLLLSIIIRGIEKR